MITEGDSRDQVGDNTRLLAVLAEELRLPLLQINHSSQLGGMTGETSQFTDIESVSKAGLRLIDSYLLTLKVLRGQQALPLAPVSLRAVMSDVAMSLQELSSLYGCEVQVKVPRRSSLVMSHKEGLYMALLGLGHTLITQSQAARQNRVIFEAHASKQKVLAGVSTDSRLDKASLKASRKLFGNVKQPMKSIHGSGAGLFIADTLFGAMDAGLNQTSREGRSGMYAALIPSTQLTLL